MSDAKNDTSRPQYSPYVEISLDNLLHNSARIRQALPREVGIIAVVKDSSYGCGGLLIAETLERGGDVAFFAVARPVEAIALRKFGITLPVLVLGMAAEEELRHGADNRVTFALNDLSEIDRWESCGVNVNFHLNIDTGMGRMGLLPDEIDTLIDRLNKARNIRIGGAFTHMANADEPNTRTVARQLERFQGGIDKLRAGGHPPAHIHYGNTATFLRFPLNGCTLARPGIALYGCKPDPAQEFDIDLKPVASLISRVVKMKKVSAGTPVSYGGNYVTDTDTWIATIPVGYAHGLPRYLNGKGSVLIGGKRYRIAGNVTMDYIMADAGPAPSISVGDEATAIGTQGGESVTPDDVALIGNTIGYEVLCNLGTTIDRFYTRNGKVVCHEPGAVY
ncbi:MAG: alanine racemase [Chitinispirillales bacterium]|jgi:alanine racemase|nr:alanine racemase [Chitinispirillales bacterium]